MGRAGLFVAAHFRGPLGVNDQHDKERVGSLGSKFVKVSNFCFEQMQF